MGRGTSAGRAAPLALLLAAALAPRAAPAAAGRDAPPPELRGRVVLDNASSRAGVPPVGFDHWPHRARHTCRLCHVDVGFAMEAGATRVSAATNRDGFHCGACHDGKRTHAGKPIFAACGDAPRPLPAACERCHRPADPEALRRGYQAFAAGLPRAGLGGAVDWEAAEAQGKVKPLDFLDGVSIPRKPLPMDRDVALKSRAHWVGEIVFSHRKHAVWNGCETCHPDIFPSTRSGKLRYTMFRIYGGEYCGVCHTSVAFPLADCERCHVKPVR